MIAENLIPEIIIEKILRQMILITTLDLKKNSNELEKSLLGYIFGKSEKSDSISLDSYNFLEQSKHVFKSSEGSRKITTSVGYNLKMVDLGKPHIHILLPSDSSSGAQIGSGIGGDSGYMEDSDAGTYRNVMTQGSEATYNLMLTTDNVNEMMLVYHWLKSCSLTFSSQFELRGLQNVSIGGNDLQFNDELIPPNVFHRNFNLSFTYLFRGVDLFSSKYGDMSTVSAKGKAKKV